MLAKLWARRSFFMLSVVIVAVAFIIFIAIQFASGAFKSKVQGIPVEFPGGTAYVQVADTEETRVLGLSGVTSLAADEGLLMDFQADDTWGIWMKDMKIPLDIIWLNKYKKVVYIASNVQPELSTTKTFKPSKAARYVIELNAGAASHYMVKVGSVVRFE